MTTDEVADMLVKKDPLLQLIDVRSKAEFDKFSLPGALNIPLNNLLAKENEDILNQSQKMNVFYSNGTLQANEAWMLMRQLGYQNMFIRCCPRRLIDRDIYVGNRLAGDRIKDNPINGLRILSLNTGKNQQGNNNCRNRFKKIFHLRFYFF